MSRADRQRLGERLSRLIAHLDDTDDVSFRDELVECLADIEATRLASIGDVVEKLRHRLTDLQGNAQLQGAFLGEIPEARKRLGYLASVTEQAAHETLGLVESIVRDVDDLQAIVASQKKLPAAFRKQAGCFLDSSRESLRRMLLAQGYQDLAGQVLKQLDSFLADFESGLEEIGKLTGKRRKDREDGALHGPRVPEADAVADFVDDQEEIDRMLADLGI